METPSATAISLMRWGWATKATRAAISTARKSTTNDGQRRDIIIPVATGTSKSQGEMTNELRSASMNWSTLAP